MQNVVQIGDPELVFSTYATRKFCWLQSITNDVPHTIDAIIGENKADAILFMVQVGAEAAFAADKKAFDLTEFEIAALVDEMTKSGKEKAEKILHAFFGSVLGKSADEVPAILEQVAKDAETAEKKAKADQKQKAKTTDTSTGENSKK